MRALGQGGYNSFTGFPYPFPHSQVLEISFHQIGMGWDAKFLKTKPSVLLGLILIN